MDWIGRNLYWTDSVLDVIEVSGLNGSNRRALISNGLDNPRAILVDPPNGYVSFNVPITCYLVTLNITLFIIWTYTLQKYNETFVTGPWQEGGLGKKGGG